VGRSIVLGSILPNSNRRHLSLLIELPTWRITMNRMLQSLVIALLTVSPFSLESATREAVLTVENMDCPSCSIVVKMALKNVEGVKEVKVNEEEKMVKVLFDDAVLTTSNIVTTVTNAGYPATIKEKKAL